MLSRNACEYTVSESVSKTLLTMCAASVGSRFTDCTSEIPAECLGPAWLVTGAALDAAAYLSGSSLTPITRKPRWPQLSE